MDAVAGSIQTISHLEAAISDWVELLGQESVLCDTEADELAAYKKTTFSYDGGASVVLKPKSRDELIELVKIAHTHKVPIYPISRGRGIGLGSKIPVSPTKVIVDLGHLNKILDFDNEMGSITVEPGVTFTQAHHFLTQKKSRLMLNTSGGPPDGSLVGNAIDRGHGFGALWDRFKHVSDMEVVLADGRVIRVGFEKFGENDLSKLSANCLGPQVGGLFSQSNLGIVTKMTFLLNIQAPHFKFFSFGIPDQAKLKDVAALVRDLKLGTEDINFYFFNSARINGVMRRDKQKTNQPKPRASFKNWFSTQVQWSGFGGIYADSPDLLLAKQKYLAAKLKKLGIRPIFIGGIKARILKALGPVIKGLFKVDIAEKLDISYFKSPFRGHPTDSGMAMCYLGKGGQVPKNPEPDLDGCGLLWFSPMIPNSPAHIQKFLDIVYDILPRYGYEPNVGLLSLSARVLDVTGVIAYDQENPEEAKNAEACYQDLHKAFFKEKYYPYRTAINLMDDLPNPVDDFSAVLSDIKRVLDPFNIIAPRKYEI